VGGYSYLERAREGEQGGKILGQLLKEEEGD